MHGALAARAHKRAVPATHKGRTQCVAAAHCMQHADVGYIGLALPKIADAWPHSAWSCRTMQGSAAMPMRHSTPPGLKLKQRTGRLARPDAGTPARRPHRDARRTRARWRRRGACWAAGSGRRPRTGWAASGAPRCPAAHALPSAAGACHDGWAEPLAVGTSMCRCRKKKTWAVSQCCYTALHGRHAGAAAGSVHNVPLRCKGPCGAAQCT